MDETHLCLSWCKHIRSAINDLGFNRDRKPANVPLILTKSTLAAGRYTELGGYQLIHHSNIRPDIKLLFRVLKAGVSGITFPDLDWVLERKRKTIIFCTTVKQANNLVTYLRNKAPRTSFLDPQRRIRQYNAVNWADHNTDVLTAFRDDPGTHIIVATDALMVGIDLPNVQDVIVLHPKLLDETLQKIGRAGRNRQFVVDARGIVYVTKKAMDDARTFVAHGGGMGKGPTEDSMDEGLLRVIAADCKTTAITV